MSIGPVGSVILVVAAAVQVGVLLGGVFTAVFLSLALSPRLDVSITPQWTPGVTYLCVLKVRIENTWRGRIKIRSICLQILEYWLTDLDHLSEWVPFSKVDTVGARVNPIEWRGPFQICKFTKYIYPGKILLVEVPLQCSKPDRITHVGLQVHALLSLT